MSIKQVDFETPDIDEPHPFHPEAHNIARMFFRCLDQLPDSAWSEIATGPVDGTSPVATQTTKRARCKALGLPLEVESRKALTAQRPFGDATWLERATFWDGEGPGRRRLAQFEIAGSGKLNADPEARPAMARHATALSISAFDHSGQPAQMSPAHWERALSMLDLEGSFGDALESLRDSSERLFEDFQTRLAKARPPAEPSAEPQGETNWTSAE